MFVARSKLNTTVVRELENVALTRAGTTLFATRVQSNAELELFVMTYPLGHVHVKDPALFLQVANCPQLCVEVAHSLTSAQSAPVVVVVVVEFVEEA